MTYVGKLDASKVYGADSTGKVGNVTPAGGGGGWQTTYELDFTTLASGSLTNGSNTIDGVTWTVENRSSAADVGINPSPGDGLLFRAAAGVSSDMYNSGRTAALLTAKLTDLDPALSWPDARGLRVFAQVAVTAPVAGDAQGLLLVLENHLASGAHANVGSAWGRWPGGFVPSPRVTIGGTSTEITGTAYGADDVICIQFFKPWTAAILRGAYSGGWPSPESMTLMGWTDVSRSTTQLIEPDGRGLQTTSALALTFALINTNTITTGSDLVAGTVKRFKIDRM